MQGTENNARFGHVIPWNKGKLIGPKPPLQTKQVWAIRSKLQMEGRTRELAMFNLAIDSKLRGCDLGKLRVEDVAPHGLAIDRPWSDSRKPDIRSNFELTEWTREAVDAFLKTKKTAGSGFLFPSRRNSNKAMTTRQYARLAKEWVSSIGSDASLYGAHSLRRTKATLIYRRTGNFERFGSLGHTKIESTVRYLGIQVDDALAMAE